MVIKNETITLVLINYNKKPYIDQALQSVANQTYQPTKVILFDDCSTDGGDLILNEFAQQHKDWVRFIQPEHNLGSPAASMNRAISYVRTHLWAAMSADDFMHPDFLKHLIQKYHKGKYDVLISNVCLVNAEGGKIERKHFSFIPNDSEAATAIFEYRIYSARSMLIRTKFFTQLGGYNESLPVHEDHEMLIRMVLNGRVAFCEPAIYYHRIVDDGVTSTLRTNPIPWHKAFLFVYDTHYHSPLLFKRLGRESAIKAQLGYLKTTGLSMLIQQKTTTNTSTVFQGFNEILELFSVDLLDKHRPIVESFRQLAQSLGLVVGWHYFLDLAWTASHFPNPAGMTILDAGGGMGLLQWWLAERGARVISVDRQARSHVSSIFYNRFRIRGLRPIDTPSNLIPRKPQDDSDGEVVFYNCDLTDLAEIETNSVDAVVSISALEHNTLDGLAASVRELERVLRPGGLFLATMSATKTSDWFHQASKGWCLTEATLREYFGLQETKTNFAKYDQIFSELKECAELRDNLHPFYFRSGDNGMPWGAWNPQYQPVGIRKITSDTRKLQSAPPSPIRRRISLAEKVLVVSNALLSQYKDKHRGQRCVIIGNGPSLNKMDLSFLKDEITFGMNRIYLMFDKYDFRPTYYVSVNPLVIEQSIEDILKIQAPKFLSFNGLPYIHDSSDIVFLKSLGGPSFTKDPCVQGGLWEGYTVTYVAMQLAYFMGFNEVILIGVDHHFTTPGQPNQEVVSNGDDSNHFHPGYFGKGIRWNLPDLENSEIAYSLAKQVFEADGRRIIDATLDGKLNIFPKENYKELFEKYREIDQTKKGNLSETSFLNQQGEDLFTEGDLDGALNAFTKAIEINPNFATAHNNLGVFYWQSGETQKAVDHFAKAMEIDPNDRDTILNCGELFKSLEKIENAKNIYSSYLRKNPNDEEIVRALADLQDRKVIEVIDEDPEYLVSAIVSTYNSEKFIRGCLENLTDQTLYKKGLLEIIIINSGSEENEDAIIKEFLKDYKNIVYLYTPFRETIYKSWNRGVSIAKGKYLTNANTDDKHNIDSYEKLSGILENDHSIGLVYSYRYETTDSDLSWKNINKAKLKTWMPEFSRDILLEGCFCGPAPMWRFSLHMEWGLFDESFKSAGDYEFWLRASQTNRFKLFKEPMVLYYTNPKGLEKQEDRNKSETKKVWNKYRDKKHTIGTHEFSENLNTLKELNIDTRKYIVNRTSDGERNILQRCFNFAQNCLINKKYKDAETSIDFYRHNIDYNQFEKNDNRAINAPDVSIVIVAYKTNELLLECLNSLEMQSFHDFEIVVIDNGLNDQIKNELLLKRILYVRSPFNLYPSEGRNIGVHYARGKIIAFLDDDATVPSNYVETIIKAFNVYDICAFRGKVLPKTENPNNLKAQHYNLGEIAIPSSINIEGNSAFRRNVYLEMKGMNPLLFGMEGLELSYRISRKYGSCSTIYWPQTCIHHDYASTDEKLATKDNRHNLMRTYLSKKWLDIYHYHAGLEKYSHNKTLQKQGELLIKRRESNEKHGENVSNAKKEILEKMNQYYKSGDLCRTEEFLNRYQDLLKKGV